ncbi:FAD-dependent oxidoreductase [Enterovibrio makurazakiensis]|uniref:flavin monoamine oxidase family protein n=1 Tax=Enterovibrio makurazakiensis TaxID=2910232 RepID=UPI003D1E5DF5
MSTVVETAIIGGGLSGLFAAHLLERQGRDYVLFEARERFGGRIISLPSNDANQANVDLGPSWYWPNINPRLSALVTSLEIMSYKQFSSGRYLIEETRGAPAQAIDIGQDIMPDTYRLRGGMQALINGLLKKIRSEQCFLGTPVKTVSKQSDNTYLLEYEHRGGKGALVAKHVVFAMPLRLISNTISFHPALSPALKRSFDGTETWMAAHAKVVLTYATPFWRDKGFSGSASSRVGPMVEIHDASPENDQAEPEYGALMGFIGINGAARKTAGDGTLKRLILQQAAKLFGPEAQHPLSIEYVDWYQETFTSTTNDLSASHGIYGIDIEDIEHPHIFFAGTEASHSFGGYLEGALDAASLAVNAITSLSH